MQSGWAEGEQEQILALMEHLDNIYSGAELNRSYNEFVVSSRMALKSLTKDSAQQVLDKQKETIESFRNTMYEASRVSAENLLYSADLADRAGLIDEESGRKLGDLYREQAEFIINNFEEAYETKMSSAVSSMKKDWTDSLSDIYSDDYRKAVTNHIGKGFQKDLKARLRKDEESAKQLLKETIDRVTNVNSITKEASELFDITGWDLLGERGKKQFFESVYQAIGVDSIRLLKDALDISASEIINISGWNSFSTEQRLQFIKAMSDAYGAPEAMYAAKKAGINVASLVEEGMRSSNPSVQAAARELADVIDREVSKVRPDIEATASLQVKVNALVEVQANFFDKVKQAAVSNAATVLESVNASGFFSEVEKKLKQVTKRANGAYGIPNGDLFIANEEGAELVGSIGGRTAVANQGQIIEGISSGVEKANAEQNALLREQNNLLRRLLEKDTTVRVGASAALGRTVQQSLNMYGAMTGG